MKQKSTASSIDASGRMAGQQRNDTPNAEGRRQAQGLLRKQAAKRTFARIVRSEIRHWIDKNAFMLFCTVVAILVIFEVIFGRALIFVGHLLDTSTSV